MQRLLLLRQRRPSILQRRFLPSVYVSAPLPLSSNSSCVQGTAKDKKIKASLHPTNRLVVEASVASSHFQAFQTFRTSLTSQQQKGDLKLTVWLILPWLSHRRSDTSFLIQGNSLPVYHIPLNGNGFPPLFIPKACPVRLPVYNLCLTFSSPFETLVWAILQFRFTWLQFQHTVLMLMAFLFFPTCWQNTFFMASFISNPMFVLLLHRGIFHWFWEG